MQLSSLRCAVTLLAFLCAGLLPAAAQAAPSYTLGPSIEEIGGVEIVHDPNQSCSTAKTLDQPVRAYRDAQGVVFMTLPMTRDNNQRMTGLSLDDLTAECHQTLDHNGEFETDPSTYHTGEHIAATYRLPNTSTVLALVHQEYRGWEHGQCSPVHMSQGGRYCWERSITHAVSNDGGANYTHPTPPPGQRPIHRVANVPYRYTDYTRPNPLDPDGWDEVGAIGHSDPTNIVRSPDNGYYYSVINSQQFPKEMFANVNEQKYGSCVMRTADPADPASWRAWGDGNLDGTFGYEIEFIDPYDPAYDPQADPPVKHVCEPVVPLPTVPRALTYNTFLNKYMLLGNERGLNGAMAYYYALSDDLVTWTSFLPLLTAGLPGQRPDDCVDIPNTMPSMIDPSDPSINFERPDQTTFLYFNLQKYRVDASDNCVKDGHEKIARNTIRFAAVPPADTDLAISQSDSPDPVIAGQTLTYAVNVSNGGPADASGVTVTDTLPVGVGFVSAVPSQGSCSLVSSTVVCAMGALAASASASVEVKVTPTAPGKIFNSARVTATQLDPDLADTRASTSTTVIPAPGSIVVVKDAAPNDPQDFSFAVGGGLTPASFALDDDSDPGLSNTRTFADLVPQSGYSISEAVPAGWYQGSATCSDGSPVSNVDVQPGETVTCTFVNSRTYARPGGATPLRVPLVPAYRPCTSPSAIHAAPLARPSCTPPVPESGLLTTSSVGRSNGSVSLRVIVGDSGTPADEADVEVAASVTDVKRSSDASDYVGPAILAARFRITDRSNGPSGSESGTVTDTELALPMSCVEDPTPNFGGRCSVSASIDATLGANFAREGSRAVISALSVTVLDAGADGSIAAGGGCPVTCGTGDENVFLDQGMFAP